MLVFEAIATRRALRATYNRGVVTLAPHVLYTRNDSLHVDAVTLDRDGQPPREEKLGVFKLDGLTGLELTDRPFDISMLYDAGSPKYADVVFAVETGSIAA